MLFLAEGWRKAIKFQNENKKCKAKKILSFVSPITNDYSDVWDECSCCCLHNPCAPSGRPSSQQIWVVTWDLSSSNGATPCHRFLGSNWLWTWIKILTQLRFIHNWVIMGIQWMVRQWVLVQSGSISDVFFRSLQQIWGFRLSRGMQIYVFIF
jgi:hypothetical protein